MPAVKQTLYITSQELCKILGINATELYDIELFFDANPDDEWELRERKDYKIVVASTGLREYTESGAYTIAKYLEAHHHKGFWQKLIENITEWFLHTKKKINQSFVKTKILNNSSSLIKRNNIFFISKKDVVKIFGTRSDYLRKMDEQARSIQFSLIKGEDYQEIDGELYYSLKGIYTLSLVFAENLSVKNRLHFHFMGGADKASTIDNFIAFVQSYYPENSDLVIKLQARKIALGDQQPLGQGKSHVLYLPLSQLT